MTVLRRAELEDSPLADLHAIASELGLEAFRSMRRDDLVAAILDAQGGEENGDTATEAGLAEAEEPDSAVTEAGYADEDVEPPADEEEEEPPAAEEDLEPPAAEEDVEPPEEPAPDEAPAGEEEPEVVEEPKSDEEIVTGMLDILPNGSGFIRIDPASQSRDDVYVAPAQIRRCELRAGDAVSGPVRPPRRNERHPSLVRVETVNGGPAEPPEERPEFAELTPVFARERLEAPAALAGVPFGKGSRVAIGGPPGAGATSLLREIAVTLAERHPDVELQIVLAGARPEEVAEWRASASAPVSGGSFERSGESQGQAAELAVERAKRAAERGAHAALLIDSLEALPAAVQRRVFGAGRATEEAGSVTVIAATGDAVEVSRWATTRVMLEPAGAGGPVVSAERSGTLRADALG